jgi:hypothetical protein
LLIFSIQNLYHSVSHYFQGVTPLLPFSSYGITSHIWVFLVCFLPHSKYTQKCLPRIEIVFKIIFDKVKVVLFRPSDTFYPRGLMLSTTDYGINRVNKCFYFYYSFQPLIMSNKSILYSNQYEIRKIKPRKCFKNLN